MINKDRIVPVMKTDLLTLYGTIMKLDGTSFSVLESKDVEGNFEVTGTGSVGNFLANQPVKSVDFKSGVTAGVVYFVPGYDFEEILVAGAAATIDDSGLDLEDVIKDGCTLYSATLGSGEVTIAAITPIVE